MTGGSPPGRGPFCGMAPMAFLLVLCLHLQGSASRCIDQSFGQDLQPLPPGVKSDSLLSGLLQPDVSPPRPGTDGIDGGDSRIVGGSPATSGGLGGRPSTFRPSFQGDSPFQYGKPGRPEQFGSPEGPIFGGIPAQFGGPSEPGPVRVGRPVSPVQYEGGAAGQYGGISYDGSNSGYRIGYNTRQGFPRPVWKNPGIPYIPTAQERGGPYYPLSKEPSRQFYPNAPYVVPYGGGTDAYSSTTYGGGSTALGPQGRYDGSYGPIPEGLQPVGQSGRDSAVQGPPCIPAC
ncbi:collagen alpha-2(IV) chain-like [Rhineura floridana]|uniref:collagen alpha-2(IV) chain-like n=1 Tax=Rhineura floridana TaxID=261503 RepID=UPI002AC8857B|nr:collagen alpha-2(IV) chain-like [Rhineura floridana]